MVASIDRAKYYAALYCEITFVGHSKGGAEAAANAVATNKNAILFNPASVNLKAYGLDAETYTAEMTAFIVKGEILDYIFGDISEPIGRVVYLPQQYPTDYSGNTTLGTLKKNIENRIENHLMEAVISALKQAGFTHISTQSL